MICKTHINKKQKVQSIMFCLSTLIVSENICLIEARKCTWLRGHCQTSIEEHNQEFFRAREVSWRKGTSINISSTTNGRKAKQGKTSEFFLLDPPKTSFQLKNLTHRWTQIRGLFSIFKKEQELSERVSTYLGYHINLSGKNSFRLLVWQSLTRWPLWQPLQF